MKPTPENDAADQKIKLQSVLFLIITIGMFIYNSKRPKSKFSDTSLFENFVLGPSCILQLVLCVWMLIWTYNSRLSYWVQFFVFFMTLCFFLADVVLRIGE